MCVDVDARMLSNQLQHAIAVELEFEDAKSHTHK